MLAPTSAQNRRDCPSSPLSCQQQSSSRTIILGVMIGHSPSLASFASRTRNRHATGWATLGLHFLHHSRRRPAPILPTELATPFTAIGWLPQCLEPTISPTTLTTKIAIRLDSALSIQIAKSSSWQQCRAGSRYPLTPRLLLVVVSLVLSKPGRIPGACAF